MKLDYFKCDTRHKVSIKPAANPSDILWLGYGVTKKEQCIRGLIATIIVMIICAIIYFLFSLMISAKIYINYRAVPPGVNCENLVDNYTREQLTDLAGLEYLYLDSLETKLHDLMK